MFTFSHRSIALGNWLCIWLHYLQIQACAGSGIVRIDPLCFLAECRKKATKPGSLCLCLSIVFSLCYCLLGLLLCIVSFHWYMFCLLVVLVKLSVLAKWLSRKTSQMKPNCGEGIVSTRPRLKIVYDFLRLVYCFMVCLCCSPSPTWYTSYTYSPI